MLLYYECTANATVATDGHFTHTMILGAEEGVAKLCTPLRGICETVI